MKKDLDFALSEIERLRAKLVVEDDYEFPPLSDDLFGSINSKEKSNKISLGRGPNSGCGNGFGGLRDLSMENSDRMTELFQLKQNND